MGVQVGMAGPFSYEEGVWVPVLSFGNLSVGITYGVLTGQYTKIGRQLHLYCNIVLTSKGVSVGTARIRGIPFAPAYNFPIVALPSSGMAGLTPGGAILIGMTPPDHINLMFQTAAGVIMLTDANFTNASSFRFGLIYII